MSADHSAPLVEALAEREAEGMGYRPWEALTPAMQDRFRGIAREKLATLARKDLHSALRLWVRSAAP